MSGIDHENGGSVDNAGASAPGFVLSGDLEEAARLADTMWDAWQAAGLPPTHWPRPCR